MEVDTASGISSEYVDSRIEEGKLLALVFLSTCPNNLHLERKPQRGLGAAWGS